MPNWVSYQEAMAARQSTGAAQPPLPGTNQGVATEQVVVAGTGGQSSNAAIRKRAGQAMDGNLKHAMLTVFVFGLVVAGSGLIPILGPLLVTGPLLLGLSAYMLMLSRGEPSGLSTLFAGFNHFGSALLLHILTGLLTFLALCVLYAPFTALSFFLMPENPEMGPGSPPGAVFVVLGILWMLLVMAVIFYFQARFAMAFYCLADVADGAIDALKLGWGMTKGKSFKLFRFYWFYPILGIGSFVLVGAAVGGAGAINETLGGLAILITFPIWMLFMLYVTASLFNGLACFYDDLKEPAADATEESMAATPA